MNYVIKQMSRENVAQVTEIDRQAFPTMWPPANYDREMDNHMAYYLVAVEHSGNHAKPEQRTRNEPGFLEKLRDFLIKEDVKEPIDNVVGFAGFWLLAGEAHIISIAVRKELQAQGIGSLLLVNLIQDAVRKKA